MKRKSIFVLVFICFVVFLTATAAVGSSWVKISDPDCNSCIMNDVDRKCGKCLKEGKEGFMAQVDGTGKVVEDNYLRYDYKCNRCGHVITYKNK